MQGRRFGHSADQFVHVGAVSECAFDMLPLGMLLIVSNEKCCEVVPHAERKLSIALLAAAEGAWLARGRGTVRQSMGVCLLLKQLALAYCLVVCNLLLFRPVHRTGSDRLHGGETCHGLDVADGLPAPFQVVYP